MSAAKWRVRGFELDRRLGAGATSEVWRATVVPGGDAVALKRLPLADGEQAQRAVAEAAKLRVLDHPHLVRLHDLILHRDAAVLVLDLADAGSLADLLAVRGRLTPGEAITALAPVAAALAHVHAAGVVHGDVSPANVLFTREGVPLLADLGVSRLTGDAADAESTPAYVDPLVARGGVPTSHSDVFMLGALALHVFTGAPLWTASTGDAALAQACSGGLGHVEGRLAVVDLPPAMSAVIRRALGLDPGTRGTAADFALDLRHSGHPVAVELAAGRARVAARSGPATDRGPDPVAPDPELPGPPRAGAVRAVPVRSRTAPPLDEPVPAPPSLTRPRRLDTRPPAASPPAAALPVSRGVLPAPTAEGAAIASAGSAQSTRSGRPPTTVDVPAQPSRPGGRHAAVAIKRVRRHESGGDEGSHALERARQIFSGRARPGPELRPRNVVTPTDAARPHFTRPTSPVQGTPCTEAEVVVGRPAPTRAVQRARPALPSRRRRLPTRSVALGSGALVAVAAAVLGAVMIGHDHLDASAAPIAPDGSTSRATRTAPVPPVPSSPTSTSSVTVPSTPQTWTSELRRLDDIRQRAFATHDVALLARVYVAGPLRAADTASLTRLVPAGCGLVGVRTHYRAVSSASPAGQHAAVTLTAQESLPPTRLICSGRVVRTAAGLGPTRVRLTLVRHGAAMLISAERVLP